MERRAAKRLNLELRVDILEVDGHPVHLTGTTRDISSLGVRLLTAATLKPGATIAYAVEVSQSAEPLQMSCSGTVIRTDPHPKTGLHEVALNMQSYELCRAPAKPRHTRHDDIFPGDSAT